jgi:hypothetical protein
MNKRMDHPGIKKQLPPLAPKYERRYSATMAQAFEALDGDNHEMFWAKLDELNDIAREARGG